MKKVQIRLGVEKKVRQKDRGEVKIFASVKAIRAKRRSASPLQDYTKVMLSTYKKFRMVIPNFL